MKAFILLAFILFLTNCSPNSNNSLINPTPPIVERLEIEIPNDFFRSPLDRWHHNRINDDDYLFTGGMQETHLYIFPLNISKKSYEKTIKISKEGPDGFESYIPDFYVQSFDSIFIFPEASKKFLLYNNQGELLKTFPFETSKRQSFTSTLRQQSVFKRGNHLYLNAAPYDRTNQKEYLEDNYASYKYDLKNEVIEPLYKYPKEVQGNILPSIFIGSQHVIAYDSLLITNYFFSKNLMTENLNKTGRMFFPAGLNGYNHLNGLNKPVQNNQKEALYIQSSYPRYMNLLYDDYRNKVYRIVEHNREQYKNYSGKEITGMLFENMQESNKILTMTLIQINKNLKVERMIEVPGCSYYIPVKEGLFVCSYDEKETKNVFHILKL